MAGILTTLEKVRIHLDMKDETDQDDLLEQLIDQVDELIGSEIGRGRVPGSHPMSSVAATEFYDGKGYEELILRRRPVTVVTRVAVDATGYFGKGTDAFPVANDWVEGTDFVSRSLDESEQNPGILLSLRSKGFSGISGFRGGQRGVWIEGRGNIHVTYTAGYATIPKDLEYAANQLITAVWNASDVGLGGPIDSTRLGDQAFQLLQNGEGPVILHVRRVIAKYKEA